MTLVAYYIFMWQVEIIELTWDKIDLEWNFIRLAGTATKNGSKRRIPIHPRVREMLINLPRGLHTNRVFLSKRKPVNNFAVNYKLQWSRAVKETRLGDFIFHDLRHCPINRVFKLHLASYEFTRFSGLIDTYMDTTGFFRLPVNCLNIFTSRCKTHLYLLIALQAGN